MTTNHIGAQHIARLVNERFPQLGEPLHNVVDGLIMYQWSIGCYYVSFNMPLEGDGPITFGMCHRINLPHSEEHQVVAVGAQRLIEKELKAWIQQSS